MAARLPPLIAVHGARRSGKGTVADHLAAAHGYRRVKFSAALKDMIAALLRACGYGPQTVWRCIEGDLKEAPLAALGGKSVRYAMQTLGTEWRDLFGAAMWGGIARGQIREAHAAGGRVVVDDFRFHHERPILRGEGAVLWTVTSEHAALRATPPPAGDAFAGGRQDFGLCDAAIAEMVRALLAHCPLDAAARAAAARGDFSGEPIPALMGRSARFAFRTLREDWRAMMEKPWTPSAAATAGHVSEQPLPAEWFSVHLANDSGFADLHRQIDVALAAA